MIRRRGSFYPYEPVASFTQDSCKELLDNNLAALSGDL